MNPQIKVIVERLLLPREYWLSRFVILRFLGLVYFTGFLVF